MHDRNHLTSTLLLLPLILTLFIVSSGIDLVAQERVSVYPDLLYRGENRLTFYHSGGIERIEIASTRYIIAERSTGILPDCPDSVSIDVVARSVTNEDELTATVYRCDGKVDSMRIEVERWTILQEFTGAIPLRSDTCLTPRIESFSIPVRLLDTITVTNPNFTVELIGLDSVPHQRGPDGYVIPPGRPFFYRVCYTAREVGYGTDTILLHFRRLQPSGPFESYTIAKVISWAGVRPPDEEIDRMEMSVEDRPVDPTSFRNILLPTARSMDQKEWFYGNYLLAGHLVGYGATDRLTLLAGGSFVPEVLARFYLGTIGAKYELLRRGELSIAAGTQLALSSVTDSDIRTIAPYGIVGYGNERSRLTFAAGYGFKRHVTPGETFDRNAFVFGIGANHEVAAGWKVAAELATIQSSGILPLLLTGRRFGESWAIDFGLGFNLSGEAGVSFNDALSGEIDQLNLVPFLSGMWVF